eukprot:2812977-Prorocentrum_lima.AAC.1
MGLARHLHHRPPLLGHHHRQYQRHGLPPILTQKCQHCAHCHHQTAHAYFESMEPYTDTESDDAELNDDEEYQSLLSTVGNDPHAKAEAGEHFV